MPPDPPTTLAVTLLVGPPQISCPVRLWLYFFLTGGESCLMQGRLLNLLLRQLLNACRSRPENQLHKKSPVSFHHDLRPKKVDSFIKKFLKQKGANFNPTVDCCELNLAGRILDPLGPLSGLWQTALSAQHENTGIDTAVVVEAIQRAMSLIGNASHRALVDRRKGLLAKISP